MIFGSMGIHPIELTPREFAPCRLTHIEFAPCRIQPLMKSPSDNSPHVEFNPHWIRPQTIRPMCIRPLKLLPKIFPKPNKVGEIIFQKKKGEWELFCYKIYTPVISLWQLFMGNKFHFIFYSKLPYHVASLQTSFWRSLWIVIMPDGCRGDCVDLQYGNISNDMNIWNRSLFFYNVQEKMCHNYQWNEKKWVDNPTKNSFLKTQTSVYNLCNLSALLLHTFLQILYRGIGIFLRKHAIKNN